MRVDAGDARALVVLTVLSHFMVVRQKGRTMNDDQFWLWLLVVAVDPP